MSASIMEALQNAEINLGNGGLGLMLAKSQLHNAVTLLEKGYSIDDEVEPLIEQYGDVESIPESGLTQRAADECPACEGGGLVIFKGNSMSCSACNGSGIRR